MNMQEAEKLIPGGEKTPTVTISRNYGKWTGKVVGIVDEPALILEQEDGFRTVIVLDGAKLESTDAG